MNLPQNYANVDMAQEIARRLYPDARNITMIKHSADNIVALIDADYAVRFPRHKHAYLRGEYEKHILNKLQNIETITIPRILNEHTNNPPYVITSFVPGHHMSPATVRALPEDIQHQFAQEVSRFAYKMHTAFTLSEELALRKELGLDELDGEEPWPDYFKRVVGNGQFSTPLQEKLAKQCYSDWAILCDIAPTVVVHDDLHTENMMFDNDRLVGVLDFGDANVGTPEQDLRQLYRISEEVMLLAVREYEQLSGHQLNIEAIKLWAIMKELADFNRRLANKNTAHHSFKRASLNLNKWLPEGEWGKGFDLTNIESYQ